MARRRITIRIVGTEGATVRLSDFLEQLHAIRVALQHTLRVADADADDPRSVYYRIVDLRHKSPFAVVMEEISDNHVSMPEVAETFVRNISQIQRPRPPKVPPVRDIDALESYRLVGAPLQKRIARVDISIGRTRVALDRDYPARITRAIGPDIIEHGSVSGRLERVNFHNTTRFEIFPPIGPKKVVCRVTDRALRQRVKEAVEEFVTVYGTVRFKQWDPHPYAIDVKGAEDIEIHPSERELPTILDVFGMAPNATGALSAEEFIEKLRNGE